MYVGMYSARVGQTYNTYILYRGVRERKSLVYVWINGIEGGEGKGNVIIIIIIIIYVACRLHGRGITSYSTRESRRGRVDTLLAWLFKLFA